MESNNPKIIFFGTPEFAAGILKSLIEAGHDIAAVFTQPDRKIGRKQEVVFSPVKRVAQARGARIFQPENLRDVGTIGEIRKIGADLMVVAAFGKILPKEILEIPRFGSINVHASLLPRYRGASPVQSAILEGEKETGVTLMLMNEKMDEGDILAQKKIKIGKDDTGGILLEKLGKLGAEMTVKLIPEWVSGKIKPRPQNGAEATYCKIVKREDGKTDWNDTAEKILRKYRAYFPWPGIYAFFSDKGGKKRLKLTDIGAVFEADLGKEPGEITEFENKIVVQTGKGAVVLKRVQAEGKKETDIRDFLRGQKDFPDMILS